MARTPLVIASIFITVTAVIASVIIYNTTLHSQDSSTCRDPDSISSHVYNPGRLQAVKQCVTASGTVADKREEADGDYHILVQLDSQYADLTNQANLDYQHGWLVVEIICVLPVTQQDAIAACQNYNNTITIPDLGQHVTFSGPYVLDSGHNYWAEVHPVFSMIIS